MLIAMISGMITDREIRVEETRRQEEGVYYDYDHATGRHILKNGDALNQPKRKYSWKCCFCNLVDLLMFCGYIAFLFFAIRYALYCLENSDGGD